MATVTAGTTHVPRYASPEDIATSTIGDIPTLVRLAWNHALLFAEFGGEAVEEDLLADLKEITAREQDRLTAGTRDTVAIKVAAEAHHIATRALRSASRTMAEGLAGIAVEGMGDGFDPAGFFVYLLWESKDAPKPIYVGQSMNILSRLGSHLTDRSRRYRIRWVTLFRCESASQMGETEHRLIRHYRPELNIIMNGAAR
jgi:hypothetical protein